MKETLPHIIRSSVIGTTVLLALLFIPAGTLNYWQGWAYVAVATIASGAYTVYLAKYDPALLKRRTEAGIAHEKEPAQKVIISFLLIAFIALVVLPPIDVRFGWSRVPWYISVFGSRSTKAAVHGLQTAASVPKNPIVGALARVCDRHIGQVATHRCLFLRVLSRVKSKHICVN